VQTPTWIASLTLAMTMDMPRRFHAARFGATAPWTTETKHPIAMTETRKLLPL
jgi:hypothetical protein